MNYLEFCLRHVFNKKCSEVEETERLHSHFPENVVFVIRKNRVNDYWASDKFIRECGFEELNNFEEYVHMEPNKITRSQAEGLQRIVEEPEVNIEVLEAKDYYKKLFKAQEKDQ